MTTKKTKAAPANATSKTKHLGHEYDPSVTNWTNVSFPADTNGLTGRLRSEFRTVIQRCHGSDDKFRLVLDNLEVLMAWAETKLEADKEAKRRAAEVAAARSAEEAKREAFRARIQAGPSIRVSATSTGFVELTRDGSVRATYETADDEQGPVASMAQMMIAEGREPTTKLIIDAFGRPGIGSGQTLAELAGMAVGSEAPAPRTSGGLQAIRA